MDKQNLKHCSICLVDTYYAIQNNCSHSYCLSCIKKKLKRQRQITFCPFKTCTKKFNTEVVIKFFTENRHIVQSDNQINFQRNCKDKQQLYPLTENNKFLLRNYSNLSIKCSLCKQIITSMWFYINICFHKYCYECLSQRIQEESFKCYIDYCYEILHYQQLIEGYQKEQRKLERIKQNLVYTCSVCLNQQPLNDDKVVCNNCKIIFCIKHHSFNDQCQCFCSECQITLKEDQNFKFCIICQFTICLQCTRQSSTTISNCIHANQQFQLMQTKYMNQQLHTTSNYHNIINHPCKLCKQCHQCHECHQCFSCQLYLEEKVCKFQENIFQFQENIFQFQERYQLHNYRCRNFNQMNFYQDSFFNYENPKKNYQNSERTQKQQKQETEIFRNDILQQISEDSDLCSRCGIECDKFNFKINQNCHLCSLQNQQILKKSAFYVTPPIKNDRERQKEALYQFEERKKREQQ